MNTSTNRENATLKPVKKIYKIKKDISEGQIILMLISFALLLGMLLYPMVLMVIAYIDWHMPNITRTEFWTYIRCLSVCFASSGSILWNAVEAVPKEEEKP